MKGAQQTMWKLEREDEDVIESLIRFVESLVDIRVRKKSYHDLQGLARLLIGLRRLPAFTGGIDLTLSISRNVDGEFSHQELELSQECLRLGYSGVMHSPAGPDSVCRDALVLHSAGGREGDKSAAYSWISDARRLSRRAWVSVEDHIEDAGIDWNEDTDTNGWLNMDQHD